MKGNNMKTKSLLLIVLISLFCGNLFSQEDGTIIYTDFEPDSVIYPVHIDYIDINYDNEWDIKFIREIYCGYGVLEHRFTSNNDFWSVTQLSHEYGDPLSSINVWYNNVELLKYGYHYHIALRHQVEGKYYYGWMKLYVEMHDESWHDPSVTITEMAYCTIPYYPLKFGQKSLTEDVAEIDDTNYYSLYPNPASDYVKLSAISYQQSAVKIYNALGMLVDEYEMNSGEIEINVSDYKSGIYFIDVDGVMNKLVIR